MAKQGPACQPRGIVPFWGHVTIVPNCDRSGMPSRGCEIGQPEIVVNSVWVHVGIQGMVHRVAVHFPRRPAGVSKIIASALTF